MKFQMINAGLKPEPIAEDISEDLKNFELQPPPKKVMAFPCTMSLIMYAVAASILIATIFRDESDEKKEAVGTLLMLKMYAWMAQIFSVVVPFDDDYDNGNSRCTKFTKMGLIFTSMLAHFICIPLYSDLLSTDDIEMMTATFFHGMGFILEGCYFRNVMLFLFSEEMVGSQGLFPYDAPLMFGIV